MLSNFKYGTFGLKKEWIEMFLTDRESVFSESLLGPRQKDSLFYYLKDIELINSKNQINSNLFNAIEKIYKNEKIESKTLWSLVFLNLCFNSTLFSWWQYLPKATYSRNKILELMVIDYRKQNRYVINGLMSLIGTFEYTPIGSDLKIGIVTCKGRERSVKKEGGFPFNPYVILYAIYKLAERTGKYEFTIGELAKDQYGPQKILLIKDDYIMKKLLVIEDTELLGVEVHDDKFLVKLNNQKSYIDALKLYLDKEGIV